MEPLTTRCLLYLNKRSGNERHDQEIYAKFYFVQTEKLEIFDPYGLRTIILKSSIFSPLFES